MAREHTQGVEVFLTILREGSLRAAARALGVGPPSVSHQLKALEQRLGVTLLVRTTRSLELTEAGRTLFARAGPAFQEIDAAIAACRAVGRAQTGELRLTLPTSANELILSPALPAFRARYPDILLDVSINEATIDLVKEGFHAGFRLGDRLSPGMVALRLTGPLEVCLCASPAYLARAGRPTHPRDLLHHQCVRYKFISANRLHSWRFVEDGQTKVIDAPRSIVFDEMDAVRQAALDGLGVAWTMRAMIDPHLAEGRLETVLNGFTPPVEPFYVFYPEQHRRYEPLRLLLDLLAERRRLEAAPSPGAASGSA